MKLSICMICILVVSHTLHDCDAYVAIHFTYNTNRSDPLGVYNWPALMESCGGGYQSPINIRTDLVRYGAFRRPLSVISSNKPVRGTFKNNGHSACFILKNPLMMQLTNIPRMPGVYHLHEFHFHYGGSKGRPQERVGEVFRGKGLVAAGSEHLLDGTRFEGEVHFVFCNRNIEEPEEQLDGAVVVAIFVQFQLQIRPLSKSDSEDMNGLSNFLLDNINSVHDVNKKKMTSIDMSIFFNEKRTNEFYTYQGSTTTPSCHQPIRWVILKKPIYVTEDAWHQLTAIRSKGYCNAQVGNYRNKQSRNNRIVEANFGPVNPVILDL